MSALLLRLDTRDGMTKWRPFRDHEHATNHGELCKAFGLDPVRARFDFSRSALGQGSDRGDTRRQRGLPGGFVFFAGHDEPIGVITFTDDREQFRDRDPTNPRDLFALDSRLR